MNIAEALAEMSEWEDVAVELYKRGVTGRQSSACGCPVANYLRLFAEEGAAGPTVVPFRTETAYVSEYFEDSKFAQHDLPENVAQFARDFDAGKHPELVGN